MRNTGRQEEFVVSDAAKRVPSQTARTQNSSTTWSTWQLRRKRELLALGVFFYFALFVMVNTMVAVMLARTDYACP